MMSIIYDDDIGLHEWEDPPLSEQWTTLANLSGRYEINGEGQIRSLLRKTRAGRSCGGIMVPWYNSPPMVALTVDGETSWYLVSHLMALSWWGPYKELLFIDGDKENVCWDNLVVKT